MVLEQQLILIGRIIQSRGSHEFVPLHHKLVTREEKRHGSLVVTIFNMLKDRKHMHISWMYQGAVYLYRADIHLE